MRTILKFRW